MVVTEGAPKILVVSAKHFATKMKTKTGKKNSSNLPQWKYFRLKTNNLLKSHQMLCNNKLKTFVLVWLLFWQRVGCFRNRRFDLYALHSKAFRKLQLFLFFFFLLFSCMKNFLCVCPKLLLATGWAYPSVLQALCIGNCSLAR